MTGECVDLIIRHQALARRAEAIAVETAFIERHLHALLRTYLAQHVPERAGVGAWRWAIRTIDERGVLFACDTFFHGFDTPGPREVLMPLDWIWRQQHGAAVKPSTPGYRTPAAQREAS